MNATVLAAAAPYCALSLRQFANVELTKGVVIRAIFSAHMFAKV